MRGAKWIMNQGEWAHHSPLFCGGTRGRRPQRDGEGGTSFASERSGTAGGTIKYEGLTGAEGVGFGREFRLRAVSQRASGYAARSAIRAKRGRAHQGTRGAERSEPKEGRRGRRGKGPGPTSGKLGRPAVGSTGATGGESPEGAPGHDTQDSRADAPLNRRTRGGRDPRPMETHDHFPAYRPRC